MYTLYILYQQTKNIKHFYRTDHLRSVRIQIDGVNFV